MNEQSKSVYALIGAFERDMRNVLEHYVVSQLGEEDALGPHFDEAARRRIEEGADDLSTVEFLDLRHEYELLNRHRDLLPSAFAREIRELTVQLDVIAPWRRKTAHYRSYGRPGGQPAAIEELLTALRSFTNSLWRELHKALSSVEVESERWTDATPSSGDLPQRVQHNLPSADYDDTGLVGRDDEIEKLLADLKNGHERVITLLGEGGIGKSALALETAYRLLDDEGSPFELVLWVSLKTERLTAYGIESISSAIDSITGATQHLGKQVAGNEFSGSIQDLANSLGGAPTLIVFDNLETTTGEEFLTLYEGLPQSVRFLVTSRNGIGQIERRKQLASLDDRHATQLFNWLVKNRDVAVLSRLSGIARQQIVRQLRNSPLALKWYVMSVEAGRNPIQSIRNQDELLSFCVRNVFEQLSDDAQIVAVALHILNRPVYQEDLTILLGLAARESQTAIQELIRHSLVVWTVSADMTLTVTLTETANAFMERQVEADHPLRQRVADREREFRQFNERTQVETRKSFFSTNVIRHRTDADRPAAMLLFRALNDFRNNQFDKAKARIEEARALAPDFWEVSRVEAFLYSSRNPELSSLKYAEAYRLADSPESRAVVAHHFGGHLARSEKDLEGALIYLREAHDVFGTPDTARALGSNLVWLGQYDEGLELLRSTQGAASGKGKVIATSVLIDGLRRRAEHHVGQSRSAGQAWSDCWEGWILSVQEIEAGTTDHRLLQNIWKNLSEALHVLRISFEAGHEPTEAPSFLADLTRFAGPLVSGLADQSKSGKYAAGRLNLLLEFDVVRDAAQGAMDAWTLAGLDAKTVDDGPGIETDARSLSVASEQPGGLEPGVVTMVDSGKGFGFIRTERYPSGVFFHVSHLQGSLVFAQLQVGQRVLIELDSQDVPRASSPRASRVCEWEDEAATSAAKAIDEQVTHELN